MKHAYTRQSNTNRKRRQTYIKEHVSLSVCWRGLTEKADPGEENLPIAPAGSQTRELHMDAIPTSQLDFTGQ